MPETNESTPMFSIENLSITYDGKPALSPVSMTIPRNRVTTVIGPSGCGKTSFLNCLNRLTDLIPNCRVEGRVQFEGEQLFNPDLDVLSLRRRVGMIFQQPTPFPTTILRNLELPLKEHGVRSKQERRTRIETSLKDVGLWEEVSDRLHSSALSLSGGQQQRLCLARSLVLEPEVLLMDEPCSALDPISSGKVEDLILSLREQYTIVVVTHHLRQARRLADEAAFFWMRDGAGCLVETGPADQIFESPQEELTAAYVRGQRG
jgi:phosphate transport system ATP-binding protein